MRETRYHNRSQPSRLALWFRGVATYDVFPEFSAKVRRLVYNPLGVLVIAALVALLCGFFLHAQGFVLFGSVAAVIVLGVLWPRVSLKGLRGSISFEKTRAVEGERVEACLTLHNRLPLAAYGLAVRDCLGDPEADAEYNQPSVSIASAPRCRTVRCRWTFVPLQRGVYPLSAPLVTTGFPFGLWENKRELSVEMSLLVWPRTYPVGPVPMVSGDQQIEGNVSRNKVGSNGDVLGVRPYRRGDSPRRIHWGQSARHDRLIVCELQSNSRPVVQLILDADPTVHVGHGPDNSREWAIRIVASLAKGWLAIGVEVGSVWTGQEISPASGPEQLKRLLDSLAQLTDKEGNPLSETLSRPACRKFTNGLQVIVTTDIGVSRNGPSRGAEHQRWVVLQAQGFLGRGTQCAANSDRSAGVSPASTQKAGGTPALRDDVSPASTETSGTTSLRPNVPICPWLLIDTPEQIPPLLRGGWKEAQHGS